MTTLNSFPGFRTAINPVISGATSRLPARTNHELYNTNYLKGDSTLHTPVGTPGTWNDLYTFKMATGRLPPKISHTKYNATYLKGNSTLVHPAPDPNYNEAEAFRQLRSSKTSSAQSTGDIADLLQTLAQHHPNVASRAIFARFVPIWARLMNIKKKRTLTQSEQRQETEIRAAVDAVSDADLEAAEGQSDDEGAEADMQEGQAIIRRRHRAEDEQEIAERAEEDDDFEEALAIINDRRRRAANQAEEDELDEAEEELLRRRANQAEEDELEDAERAMRRRRALEQAEEDELEDAERAMRRRRALEQAELDDSSDDDVFEDADEYFPAEPAFVNPAVVRVAKPVVSLPAFANPSPAVHLNSFVGNPISFNPDLYKPDSDNSSDDSDDSDVSQPLGIEGESDSDNQSDEEPLPMDAFTPDQPLDHISFVSPQAVPIRTPSIFNHEGKHDTDSEVLSITPQRLRQTVNKDILDQYSKSGKNADVPTVTHWREFADTLILGPRTGYKSMSKPQLIRFLVPYLSTTQFSAMKKGNLTSDLLMTPKKKKAPRTRREKMIAIGKNASKG